MEQRSSVGFVALLILLVLGLKSLPKDSVMPGSSSEPQD